MYTQLTKQLGIDYQIFAHASPDIVYTWSLKLKAGINSKQPYIIIPDGCLDIIFTKHDDGLYDPVLSSAFTQVQEIPISSGDHYIGIRFYPGRIRTYVSLDLQSQDDAFTLLSNNGYHTIEKFLSSIPRYHNPLEQFEDSLPALLNSSFSKRHKRRLFKQITGFTIQGFRSITKFQQSLHFPDAHQYYDQSHMTHAYNKMTGMTPRTIRDLI